MHGRGVIEDELPNERTSHQRDSRITVLVGTTLGHPNGLAVQDLLRGRKTVEALDALHRVSEGGLELLEHVSRRLECVAFEDGNDRLVRISRNHHAHVDRRAVERVAHVARKPHQLSRPAQRVEISRQRRHSEHVERVDRAQRIHHGDTVVDRHIAGPSQPEQLITALTRTDAKHMLRLARVDPRLALDTVRRRELRALTESLQLPTTVTDTVDRAVAVRARGYRGHLDGHGAYTRTTQGVRDVLDDRPVLADQSLRDAVPGSQQGFGNEAERKGLVDGHLVAPLTLLLVAPTTLRLEDDAGKAAVRDRLTITDGEQVRRVLVDENLQLHVALDALKTNDGIRNDVEQISVSIEDPLTREQDVEDHDRPIRVVHEAAPEVVPRLLTITARDDERSDIDRLSDHALRRRHRTRKRKCRVRRSRPGFRSLCGSGGHAELVEQGIVGVFLGVHERLLFYTDPRAGLHGLCGLNLRVSF